MVTIPPEYCANFHGIFRGMEYSPWTGNGIFSLDRKWNILPGQEMEYSPWTENGLLLVWPELLQGPLLMALGK